MRRCKEWKVDILNLSDIDKGCTQTRLSAYEMAVVLPEHPGYSVLAFSQVGCLAF